MSLDTKYRPLTYDDVLGQEGTVEILRSLVKNGRGFHQSVLFAGAWGSGKTTLGRIYARALLCAAPTPTGDPCDKCPSCLEILNEGTSDSFIEVDAATNSGKADIKQITEEIQFSSFSGKRRLYLFDESHGLSKDALDALLKPLEESLPGTEDKKLVCIFCTTEPEKMRSTILSRCAPVFKIKTVTPDVVAQRLARICESEGIAYNLPSLELIAQMTECHIRDAIKSVEGVSMLGAVDATNVGSYLHLDLHGAYLEVLEGLGSSDIVQILTPLRNIMTRVSPGQVLSRVLEATMLAYQVHLGITNCPVFWDADRVKGVSAKHGDALLNIAERLASGPARPNEAMVLCEFASLHRFLQGGGSWAVPQQAQNLPLNSVPTANSLPAAGTIVKSSGTRMVNGGVHLDERGMNSILGLKGSGTKPAPKTVELDHKSFGEILGKRIGYLAEQNRGST